MTARQYEVVVRGQLGSTLVRWFDDCEVRPAGPGATALRGWFVDQAALHSFLAELGDLGFELSAVSCLSDPPPGPVTGSGTDETGNRID